MNRKIPPWIQEYVPRELVESTLFRFNIELQSVIEHKCNNCDFSTKKYLKQCPNCNNKLTKVHKKVTVDFVPDLDVDIDIIESQLESLPAQISFYGMIYSELRLKVALEERRLKAIKGVILEKLRDRMKEENVRIPAEQLKTIMESDDEITKAQNRLSLAQMQCGKVYHIIEALKMKSEIGRSLLVLKRELNKGGHNAL